MKMSLKKQNKPFSKTELRILVYNKMKRGLSYEEARKEVEREILSCQENHENFKKNKINEKKEFIDEFRKLKEVKNGKKR